MFNFPKNKFRKIFFFQNSSKNVILVNPFLPHVVARVMSRIILIALKQSPIAEQHTYFYLFFNSMLCILRAGTSIIRPTGQLRSGNAKNFPLSLNRTIRLIFKTQNEITSYPSYSRTFTLQIRLFELVKLVQDDNFRVKTGLYMNKFIIRGSKWRNVSIANWEGNLYFIGVQKLPTGKWRPVTKCHYLQFNRCIFNWAPHSLKIIIFLIMTQRNAIRSSS